MARHFYGDLDFNWDALNDAAIFFPKWLKRLGRIQITSCKEKYGTMRLEWFFWAGHYNELLHSMLFPGHLYIHWSQKMRRIDRLITALAIKIGFCRLITVYQRIIFNIITIVTVKKYSDVKDEILDDLDFDTLLYKPVKKLLNYKCNWQ